MSKLYNIYLDKIKVGTTKLEKADVPMGVVFGEIAFLNIVSGYAFFRDYCSKNKLDFTDHPKDALILTRDIPNLQVFDDNNIEIKGLACTVSGMDSDCFEISIELIAYPFYEDEFPHHVKAYNKLHE